MHIYTCESGLEVPSVTTILKILGSEEIIRWANYLGTQFINYDEEMDRTADIGTIIHSCVQHVVDPDAPNEVVEFKNEFDADYYARITERFRKFISHFSYRTIFTEKSLVSESLGYGGTLDWYCEMAGFKMLNDFKSSKQVRLKHLLQLGGYYSLLKEHGYDVDGASIIIINARDCRMFPIRKEPLIDLSKKFNILASIYKELEGGNLKYELDKDFLDRLKYKTNTTT